MRVSFGGLKPPSIWHQTWKQIYSPMYIQCPNNNVNQMSLSQNVYKSLCWTCIWQVLFSTFLCKHTKLSSSNQILWDTKWNDIHRAWCYICLLLGIMMSLLPWFPHCHRVEITSSAWNLSQVGRHFSLSDKFIDCAFVQRRRPLIVQWKLHCSDYLWKPSLHQFISTLINILSKAWGGWHRRVLRV